MAKNTCAICGAEVNLITGQALADKQYICRKVCGKKCLKAFDKISAVLGDVTAHIAQVERGTKIWNEVLLPLKKSKNKEEKLKCFNNSAGGDLYVSPSTGLCAYVETRYKIFIFGKSEHACVYRIADLYGYEYETEKVKNSEGKEETKHYCVILFNNTAGLYTFRIQVSGQKAFAELEKYFDTLFGIQKTLGNMANNWKNQMNAIKAAAGAVKSAADGSLDEFQAANAAGAIDTAVFGDRTELIAKADAILANYPG